MNNVLTLIIKTTTPALHTLFPHNQYQRIGNYYD